MTLTAERIQKRAIYAITHEFLPNKELEGFPWSEAFKQLEHLVIEQYNNNIQMTNNLVDAKRLLDNIAQGRTPLLLCFVFNGDHSAVRIVPYPEQYESGDFGARIELAGTEQLESNWPANIAGAVADLAHARENNVVVVQTNLGNDRATKQFTVGYLHFNGADMRPVNRGLVSWIRKTRDDLNSMTPTPTVNTLTE